MEEKKELNLEEMDKVSGGDGLTKNLKEYIRMTCKTINKPVIP